jgi:trehalose 6-phosphate synthase
LSQVGRRSLLDNENGHHDCDAAAAERFSDRSLIIASNRGPITFDGTDDGVPRFQRGAGGLVTALIGLAQHLDTAWIACARTSADTEWQEGQVSLPDSDRELRVRFLSPEPAAYERYYDVIANPLLWFLQHAMWDVSRAPVIDRATWHAWDEGYKVVNCLFAQAIVQRLRTDPRPTLVMLQDYHLYLVARYVRDQIRLRPKHTLLHFIHIPWPGSTYWSLLPGTMRQSILDSLCAVDLLGFQTYDDALNFLRSCESYLPGAHINFRRNSVWYRNHVTHVRDFPIAIDVAALRQLAETPAVAEYRSEMERIGAGQPLIVRIDRIEPSKNIVRGFQAFEEMLELHPEHCGHVKFLALLVPSRLEVAEYRSYLDELMAAAGRVNARYGNSGWEPIRLLIGDDYERAIAALQLYDVLLVNAIVDGMNLVAKEGPIVNRRDGVLILSERTGARQQLEPGAIVIAPCDVYATAEALHQALVMSAEERHARATRLHWLLEREDIAAWICWQLTTLKHLNL